MINTKEIRTGHQITIITSACSYVQTQIMRARIFFFLILLFIQIITLTFSVSIEAEYAFAQDNWSMFQHDPAHTGYTNTTGPTTNNVLWSYQTDSKYFDSSCVIFNNNVFIGLMYHSTYDEFLCLDAFTGALKWSYNTDGYIRSSPAVANGRVYFGSSEILYCLDIYTGAFQWSYNGISLSSSPTVVEGKIYFGSSGDQVYCLDAYNGNVLWSYTIDNAVIFSPAVVSGKVYIGSYKGNIYCLDAYSGEFIWSYSVSMSSSPTVVEGKVYVGSYRGCIYCLDAYSGDIIWNYMIGSSILSTPSVANGRAYFGSNNNMVYCLDALTGKPIWNFSTGDDVISSISVTDVMIYVGSFDCKIYCLDAYFGDLNWNYNTGDIIRTSSSIYNGLLYVGSGNGKIYCFGSFPLSVILEEPSNHDEVESPVNLRVKVSASGSPVEDATVNFFIDGIQLGSNKTNIGGYASLSYLGNKGTHDWYTVASKLGYESSTSDIRTFTCTNQPTDFIIVQIISDEEVWELGEKISLILSIKNTGEIPIPTEEAEVKYWVITPDGTEISVDYNNKNYIKIAPRETYEFKGEWISTGEKPGWYDVKVQVTTRVNGIIIEKKYIETNVFQIKDISPPDTYIITEPDGELDYGNIEFNWRGKDDSDSILKYSYRLVGYEESWSEWSEETSCSYGNLPNGYYSFQVKAMDESNNQEQTPAEQSFKVSRPIIRIIPDLYNYGKVKERETPSASFTVGNDGEGIIIWNIKNFPSWLVMNPLNGTESVTFTAMVKSTLSAGFFDGYIEVSSNGGNKNVYVQVEVEDITPPDIFITSGSIGTIDHREVAFTWAGEDAVTSTSNLQYSFMLEGYDGSWSSWTSSTSKSYSSLPNGPYTFKVKSRDEAGNVDPSPAEVIFSINAPVLTVTPSSYDYEKIQEGVTPSTSFTVSNTGGGNLTWRVVSFPKWLTVSPTNGTESGSFTATIRNATLLGLQSGEIVVSSNGGKQSIPVQVTGPLPVKVTFSCTGIPHGLQNDVLVVDGEEHRASGQITFEWLEGSKHNFTWAEEIGESPGRSYMLARTTGLETAGSGSFKASENGTITACYYTKQVLAPDAHKGFSGTVLTNSSLTDVSVIQDSSVLSVIVEGESGTRGFVTVSLPWDVLERYGSSAEDVIVLLNDEMVEPGITIRGGEVVIEVVYQHSMHVLEFYLDTATLTVEVFGYAFGAPLGPIEDVGVRVLRMDTRVFAEDSTGPSGKASFRLIPSDYIVTAYVAGRNLVEEVSLSDDASIRFSFPNMMYQTAIVAAVVLLISLIVRWYWRHRKIANEVNGGVYDDRFVEVCAGLGRPLTRSDVIEEFRNKYQERITLDHAVLLFRRFEGRGEGRTYRVGNVTIFVHGSVWKGLPPNEHGVLEQVLRGDGRARRSELFRWSQLSMEEFEAVMTRLERGGYVIYHPETDEYRLPSTKHK